MLSFWERESFVNYDYIIVGGGIVGFSTAISVREKHPKASILVVEAGFLPSGASTKNAGFACVGSLSEIASDLKQHSDDEVVALSKLRYEGLKLLRTRLGDTAIDYQDGGSHELLMAGEEHLLEHISPINKILEPVFGQAIFEENTSAISKMGFQKVEGLIKNKVEGSIHTGKMMKQLILLAQSKGVEYKTSSKVLTIQDEGKQVVVDIENTSVRLAAKKVFVCTNAFAKQLLPDLDLKPGRGQVLVTKPIPHLPFKGIFHFQEGYYYFRTIENRILFGGGRNIDFETETTTLFEINEKIQADLANKLSEIIYPDKPIEIDMRWAGIMAFGQSKNPIVKNISPNVIAGVRLGGMGIAIGSKLGDLLAEMV